MKLNMMERLKLLEILPNEGNRLNLKIVRKLRESLSFSEEELKKVPAQYEFACVHQTRDKEGTITQCENKGFTSGDSPKCEEHNEPMVPTGNWRILNSTVLFANEKEIHMGEEAAKVCESALKMLNDRNKLTEAYTSLYDKFFPPRGEETEKEV